MTSLTAVVANYLTLGAQYGAHAAAHYLSLLGLVAGVSFGLLLPGA